MSYVNKEFQNEYTRNHYADNKENIYGIKPYGDNWTQKNMH